jgi:hypothetical protein
MMTVTYSIMARIIEGLQPPTQRIPRTGFITLAAPTSHPSRSPLPAPNGRSLITCPRSALVVSCKDRVVTAIFTCSSSPQRVATFRHILGALPLIVQRNIRAMFEPLTNYLCGAEYRSRGHNLCSHSAVSQHFMEP